MVYPHLWLWGQFATITHSNGSQLRNMSPEPGGPASLSLSWPYFSVISARLGGSLLVGVPALQSSLALPSEVPLLIIPLWAKNSARGKLRHTSFLISFSFLPFPGLKYSRLLLCVSTSEVTCRKVQFSLHY